MKLLLDENLPGRLKAEFNEHEVYTVADKGWLGVSNGHLLELLIENSFDVLLTFDKNLKYQQNLSKYSVSVLVLNAPDNSYATLKYLMPEILKVLRSPLKPGPTEISY